MKPGTHVYTVDGADRKHHGTITAVEGSTALVKFWDYKVPRLVPVRQLKRWL